jgi:hypothetical protein
MNAQPPNPAPHTTLRSTPAARRRARPPRGIDVPTTLWLPPAGTTPSHEQGASGPLPGWARTRLATEHTTPTRPGLAGVCHANDTRARTLRPLTITQDETAPIPATTEAGRAGLVLLEVAETLQDPPAPAQPHEGWLLPAVDQALTALAPGAVLALAFGDDVIGPHITRPGTAIAAARARGFTYQQHLIVITAALQGDRLRPLTTDRHREHRRALRARGLPVSFRAHRDLFLFTAPTPQETTHA